MTRMTELLEALMNLFRVTQRTVAMYEADCPGAAEVGYWSREDKDAYERARSLLTETFARNGQPEPDWLQAAYLDNVPAGYTDSKEGPFDTVAEAERFAEAEVGLPWCIVKKDDGYHVACRQDSDD